MHPVVLFYKISLSILFLNENIVPCRDLLLDNDRETNNDTTLTARQQILNKQQLNYNRRTAFSMWSMLSIISRTIWSNESGLSELD
jgi:hypothetical protein